MCSIFIEWWGETSVQGYKEKEKIADIWGALGFVILADFIEKKKKKMKQACWSQLLSELLLLLSHFSRVQLCVTP